MNNLIKLYTLVFFIISANWVMAQRIGYREITEKRIEYIAPRLNLTASESEKFWPMFREFYDERDKISKNSRAKNRQENDRIPETREDYLNAINFMIESKMDQANLMRVYAKRYLEILPAVKVYRLFQLDDEFNKFLLKQLKDSGPERRNK